MSFDQLTFDQGGQRAYLVDTDAIEANLKRQLQGPALSEQLEDFWLSRVQYQGRAMPGTEAMDARWSALQSAFQKKGAHLQGTWSYAQPGILLSILYSAKHGAPVGWGYEKFWDVAHHVRPNTGNSGGSSMRHLSAMGAWPTWKHRTKMGSGARRSQIGERTARPKTTSSIA